MFVDQRVRDAELAFLNAPFANDGWAEALRSTAVATGSAVVQLCGGASGPALTFNHFSREFDDPHGYLVNPAMYGTENWRINCHAGLARTIQDERHYATYREANRTEFYDDAVSDLDLPFGCQSPLLLDSQGMVGLALLRSSRDGRCTPEVIAAFARIAGQAHRAVRVQMALGRERAEDMLVGPERAGEPTLLLDGQGSIVAMTAAAEVLFDCPGGLCMEGLALRLPDEREDRALLAAIGRLLASDGIDGPLVHQAVIGRREERPDGCWQLFVTRIPGIGRDLLGMEAQLAVTLRPLA